MGVTTFTDEHKSPVPAARYFKAFGDSHNLITKLHPDHIKSVDLIQGNGGTGSIKQINFVDGGFFKYHIDEVNEETLTYSFSSIQGSSLDENNVEKVTFETKFEPTTDGGSVSKSTIKCYTKGDFIPKEDDSTLEILKAAENFLIENPHAYA